MDAPPGRVRLAVDLLKHLSRTPAQGDETNALPIQFRQLLISGQLRVENQFGREFAGMLFPEPDKLQNPVRLLVFGAARVGIAPDPLLYFAGQEHDVSP